MKANHSIQRAPSARELTLMNLISFIREYRGVSEEDQITEMSNLVEDLGITGDDGDELLMEIERHFGISFCGAGGSLREVFGLGHDEYLFPSEVSLFDMFRSLLGLGDERIRSVTVSQLFEVALKVKADAHDARRRSPNH